jgi:hypothetical protein
MAFARLEQRVAALETEVAQLKRNLEEQETIRPWWEQIAGTFENAPLYERAMRRGQHYRQSLRSKPPTPRTK